MIRFDGMRAEESGNKGSRQLPVGAVTALIGAPFFAYLFFKRRKGEM
jgi:hypothetical protein